jgi:hypothetical protein
MIPVLPLICFLNGGSVARIPGYRPRGPRFNSYHYKIFREAVYLERGQFNLVWVIEELLEWKSRGPV